LRVELVEQRGAELPGKPDSMPAGGDLLADERDYVRVSH
jgi:hypothetical protein